MYPTNENIDVLQTKDRKYDQRWDDTNYITNAHNLLEKSEEKKENRENQ